MSTFKRKFSIIELVTASTLMLIMFMIIGFVFGSVSDATTSLNDKISEGLKANRFFSQFADDASSSFPVFCLGDKSDGNYVNIAIPGSTDPLATLPGNYTTGAINGVVFTSGASHREFFRCVSTNHVNGGLLNYNGTESLNLNMNVDQNDKPVRYITYNFTGNSNIGGGLHERTIYKREFPLRPDIRKGDEIRGGYSAGSFVKVGAPGDGDTIAAQIADGDINQYVLLDGIWEIRISFLEEPLDGNTRHSNNLQTGFGDKVLVKITIEFAFTDTKHPYGDPLRYTRYPLGDTDGNYIPDYLDHSYTTVVVVNRNNWDTK